MRALTICSAAIFIAGAAGAQPSTPKTYSDCVTSPDGRVECRKVIRVGGDSMFRFEHARMDSAMMKRAMLGIMLRPTGTRRDTLGVFVESVTPKGPAEAAGVIEGDRIAAINGVDLRVDAADVEDPYTNGLAAHRLTREVRKLAPGARVTLRVYSGGRYREVQVTAGRASDFMRRGMRMRMGQPGMMHFNGPLDGPGGMMMNPEHRRMMDEGIGAEGGQRMKRRVPSGGAPMRAPRPTAIIRL